MKRYRKYKCSVICNSITYDRLYYCYSVTTALQSFLQYLRCAPIITDIGTIKLTVTTFRKNSSSVISFEFFESSQFNSFINNFFNFSIYGTF